MQGKYVVQLQKYLTEKFGLPAKYIQIEASGVTKKDKAVNV